MQRFAYIRAITAAIIIQQQAHVNNYYTAISNQ